MTLLERPAVRRGLRRFRELIGDNQALLPVVLAFTPEGFGRRIRPFTDVVIEGFPRSGNTFAVHALRLSQIEPVAVSSHVHVPAQVKLAVRRRLPTIVVLRRPVDAIASLIILAPHVRAESAFREYAHHHEELEPFADGFLVAPFEVITTDFGRVIDACNARFGTDFRRFHPDEASTSAVFESIERHHLAVSGGAVPEIRIPRPSPERRTRGLEIVSHLESPGLARVRQRAEDVYARLRQRWTGG